MTSSFAASERAGVCDALLRAGPDAPTLCEGWDGLAMAAHLYVRERDPFAGPGIVLPGPFAALTERRMGAAKKLGFGRLIATIRRSPPLHWRFVPDAVQFVEYFIHHEDVRRANDEPRRVLDQEVEDAIWRWLAGATRMYARNVPCGITLERRGGSTRAVKTGDPVATLHGEPSELLLYLAGRGRATDVHVSGPDDAVAALHNSSLGI